MKQKGPSPTTTIQARFTFQYENTTIRPTLIEGHLKIFLTKINQINLIQTQDDLEYYLLSTKTAVQQRHHSRNFPTVNYEKLNCKHKDITRYQVRILKFVIKMQKHCNTVTLYMLFYLSIYYLNVVFFFLFLS